MLEELWGGDAQEVQKPELALVCKIPAVEETPAAAAAIEAFKTGVDSTGRDRVWPQAGKWRFSSKSILYDTRKVRKLEEIPSQWQEMRVKPIPTLATVALPSETRPITCLSTSTKVLNNIIIDRTREAYEAALHPNQPLAYRKDHYTITAEKQLTTIIKNKQTRRVAFLNMSSKAFDSVSMAAIIRALDNKWRHQEENVT